MPPKKRRTSGVKNRGTNKVAAKVAEKPDAATLQGFVEGQPRKGRKPTRTRPKHLQKYVDEFAGRHNVCNADTIKQMESLLTKNVREAAALRKPDCGQRLGKRSKIVSAPPCNTSLMT